MTAADKMEFVTELGCTVRVVPPPEHMNQRGALLVLKMEQPSDLRMVSVYLSPDNAKDLEYMLRRWSSDLADKWANR